GRQQLGGRGAPPGHRDALLRAEHGDGGGLVGGRADSHEHGHRPVLVGPAAHRTPPATGTTATVPASESAARTVGSASCGTSTWSVTSPSTTIAPSRASTCSTTTSCASVRGSG